MFYVLLVFVVFIGFTWVSVVKGKYNIALGFIIGLHVLLLIMNWTGVTESNSSFDLLKFFN